jgi:hypothetical protein
MVRSRSRWRASRVPQASWSPAAAFARRCSVSSRFADGEAPIRGNMPRPPVPGQGKCTIPGAVVRAWGTDSKTSGRDASNGASSRAALADREASPAGEHGTSARPAPVVFSAACRPGAICIERGRRWAPPQSCTGTVPAIASQPAALPGGGLPAAWRSRWAKASVSAACWRSRTPSRPPRTPARAGAWRSCRSPPGANPAKQEYEGRGVSALRRPGPGPRVPTPLSGPWGR